jgi:hypothetical protein
MRTRSVVAEASPLVSPDFAPGIPAYRREE